MTGNNADDIEADRLENTRTEYTALAGYFVALIRFRLTLLGFYLAAVGLMISKHWPLPMPLAVLGLLLTVALYIFELRTRILFHHLAKRGIEIEKSWYGPKPAGELPFFSRQFSQYMVPAREKSREEYFGTQLRILAVIPFKWRFISHSLALDVLYLCLLGLFLMSLFA